MPFGVSWLTYGKYWAAAIAGCVAGSQLVHKMYKPLEGFEDLVQVEYEKLRALHPPPTLEERVARFDSLHKKLEEYEQNKKPIKFTEWFASLTKSNSE